VVGTLKSCWTGVTAFGCAVADEETGNVALDEMLVEVDEEVAEALACPTIFAGEEEGEGVEYYESGVDAVDGVEEGCEVFGKGEGVGVTMVDF
jgi:hypothetical protein